MGPSNPAPPPLLFVHTGEAPVPHYAPCALLQARLFNPQARIVFAAPAKELDRAELKPRFAEACAETVPLESLAGHTRKGVLDFGPKVGKFYTWTCERFLVLEELMASLGLEEAVHLENDVLLYMDLSKIAEPLRNLYSGRMALPFDTDFRAIPGFVYISSLKPLSAFNKYMLDNASTPMNDMVRLGVFRNTVEGGRLLANLPIVLPSYHRRFGLKSLGGRTPRHPEDYSAGTTELGAIFDAAAIGQYLGGPDPRNRQLIVERGFINETCVFQADKLELSWGRDDANRKIPFASIDGERLPIANLHIHSKALEEFMSDDFQPLHEYIHGDLFKELVAMRLEKTGRTTCRGQSGGKPPKSVFVDGDMIPFFLKEVLPKFPANAGLVIINTNDDAGFPQSLSSSLDDPRIKRWFTVNKAFEHPKLTALPLGIARPFWPHGSQRAIDRAARLPVEPGGLVYMNFASETNKAKRGEALSKLSAKPFIFNGGRKPFELYLAEQKGYRFSVCPPGNGLDSHRVWECLYTGVIPIVLDSPLYRDFPGLPLCLVKDWDELSEDFLHGFLDGMKSKTYDMSMLEFSHWRKLIRAEIRSPEAPTPS